MSRTTVPMTGYRVEYDNESVAYISDHQQPDDPRDVAESVVELCRNVDLLIHDAQYTASEFEQKKTWGHCTVEYAVWVASVAKAKRLALFHHDPFHDDEMIERMTRRPSSVASGSGSRCSRRTKACRSTSAPAEVLAASLAGDTARIVLGVALLAAGVAKIGQGRAWAAQAAANSDPGDRRSRRAVGGVGDGCRGRVRRRVAMADSRRSRPDRRVHGVDRRPARGGPSPAVCVLRCVVRPTLDVVARGAQRGRSSPSA